MKLKLRDWQERGFEYFKQNPVSLYEVGTGAGKTVFAIHCIEDILKKYPNKKVLIIGPKNVILEKTWLSELHQFGFPINKVGLYNEFAKELSQITLVSIQSCKRLIKLELYHLFDFVIFDEVHNYGTKNYMNILEIPKQYKMGLSATIKREDSLHVNIYDVFNYKIFKYGIKKALQDDILNPFDFYKIKISIDEDVREEYEELTEQIRRMMYVLNNNVKSNDINKNALNKLFNKRKLLVYNYYKKKDALKEILKDCKNSKVLVFNQYNKISKDVYWELLDMDVRSEVMNSDIDRYTQSKIFKKFENGNVNVLLATTMLDEGYNLPKIDVAVIMGANSTMKQFIQRMGRVLRKKNINSKVYYMVVEDTFEEEYLERKLPLIKDICNSYKEVNV